MMKNLGGRPKKLKVELSEQSASDIMSKAFSELEDVRQKALSFYNKALKDTRDNSSVALVGKTGAEFLKIAANATLNKVNMSKMILDHINKKNGGGDGIIPEGENVNTQNQLSNESKEELKKMLAEATKAKNNISPSQVLNNMDNKEMEKVQIQIKPKDNEN